MIDVATFKSVMGAIQKNNLTSISGNFRTIADDLSAYIDFNFGRGIIDANFQFYVKVNANYVSMSSKDSIYKGPDVEFNVTTVASGRGKTLTLEDKSFYHCATKYGNFYTFGNPRDGQFDFVFAIADYEDEDEVYNKAHLIMNFEFDEENKLWKFKINRSDKYIYPLDNPVSTMQIFSWIMPYVDTIEEFELN